MTEPKTVAEAKRLTLQKIEKCMELPHKERYNFWIKPIWENHLGVKSWCAFCLLAHKETYPCEKCPARKPCNYYLSNERIFYKLSFNKLYRKVKEIEV